MQIYTKAPSTLKLFNREPKLEYWYDIEILWNIWCGLVVWVLWHINLWMLFNAKTIFIQINSSISNNSDKREYTVQLSKTFLFQAIEFSQTVHFQTIQFNISVIFIYTQLNVKQFRLA